MIFAVEGHIAMIRNGLFWYEGIDEPDWSAKGMKEYHIQRAQFLADRPDVSKEVKKGLHLLIRKTQTRRLNRGIYQIEAERKKPHYTGYAVQRKRGVPAEPDIRIVMDKIWEERTAEYHREDSTVYPIPISKESAWAEGGYTSTEYEAVFLKLNPKRNRFSRWVFKFHAIEVRRLIKHNITAVDYTGICLHCKQKLKTDKEKEQGYCEECWEKYTDEKDAIMVMQDEELNV